MIKKIIVNIKEKANTLSLKIACFIAVMIVPLNITLIILSNRMINIVINEQITSYENELMIYMMRIDKEIDAIEQQIKNLLQENWSFLNPNIDENQVFFAKFNFWTQLKDIQNQSELMNLAYLKTHWDQETVITYEHDKINFIESQNILEELRKIEMKTYSTTAYQALMVNGQPYLWRNINYYDFSFGFLIKIDTILEPLKLMTNIEGEKIVLYDLINEGLIETMDTQNLDLESHEYLQVSYQSVNINHQIIRLIPTSVKNTEIPIIEKVIQGIGILSIFVFPFIWYFLNQQVIIPLRKLASAMKEVENENLDYRLSQGVSSEEFKQIYHIFNQMVEQIKTLKISAYERDIEKLQLEATTLRLQLNPHLLLNSLNLIYSLTLSKNYECIKEYTLHLSEYFRYSLKQKGHLVTIKSEIDFVKNYIQIQKIRFPNAFKCIYDLDVCLDDKLIPPLIIQNFVENCMKYALKDNEVIQITIRIKEQANCLLISICDTGNGIHEAILEKIKRGEVIENRMGSHIGIWNCRRRLNYFYKDEATLNVNSVIGKGTEVIIKFPINRIKKEG